MPAVTTAFDHDAALRGCARGDQNALRRLYEHESRWLLGIALRIVRERAAAEDVVHDAFLRIWRSAASFDASLGSGRGWVCTVVRHCALDHARRSGREAPPADPAVFEATLAAAVAPEWTFDVESLERCMGQLDEQRRRCVLYAFVEGCTHEEIAARVEAPLGTVKSWIRRSLVSLKECLT